MKVKAKRIISVIFLAMIIALVFALAGCTGNGGKVQRADAAERIQVDDTHVYLAPSGAPSTYKLKPLVYPIETASQSVYYRLVNSEDKKYLNIREDGTLQAKGELKTDDEGNNLDIIVRIISSATPTVSLDVTVTIETVEVERILFQETTLVLELTSPGVQLEPIFYPAHALTGRNVLYSSDNENIAEVDVNGFVRPVGIGKVAIWVTTPKQGAFGSQVETHINIDVRYSHLNYRLDLTTGVATLKQIYGQSEEIGFVLSQLDENCDPSPSVTWYVNTTPIDGVGVKDSKVLKYDPSSLPIGEYNIRAVLNNSTQQQELVSQKITIYGPLNVITLDVLNNEIEYVENDSLNLLVTYAERVYPPESYVWSIVYTDLDNTVHPAELINQAPAVQEGYIVKPDFTYVAKLPGKYEISATAVVKGVISKVVSETKVIYVGERPEGNDITDLHLDGKIVDGEAYPMIAWKPLPYENAYTVEVKVGASVTTLTSSENSALFTNASVYIPLTIADFEKDFSVRIKSEKFGSWTEWINYTAGTVKAGAYNYFNEISGGHNGYIADMRELGNLINYVAVFRPSALLDASGAYRLSLYVPFTYDSLPHDRYPVSEADIAKVAAKGYNEAQLDTYKLVLGVLSPYVESLKMSAPEISESVLRGARTISLKFLSENAPSERFTVSSEVKEVNSYLHYTDTPREADAELPIDALEDTMVVATSNQLYLAVAMGKRPLPVTGSAAARIYEKARGVLRVINGDETSDRLKVLAIYDWLSSNVTYDYDISAAVPSNPYIYNSFYLEGVFDDGVAVCDGLAKAFTLMCGIEGIPTYRICGYERSGGVAHAWNAVLLDGLYYVVDITWSNYKFSMVSESGEETYEIISYAYLAQSGGEAQRKHFHYGDYNFADGEGLKYSYLISIGEGYDTEVDSDAELGYIVKNYMPSILGDEDNVWIELDFVTSYLYSKGGSTGSAEIANSIKGIIRANIPAGYGVLTLDGSTGILFVNLYKISS